MLFLPKNSWEIRTTKSKGRGIFVKQDIKPGTLIGDYLGTIVHPRDTEIDDKKFYLMYYHDTATIVPEIHKHGVHLLNHACVPNCSLYIYKGHTLAFALRHITSGEELTINYALSPQTEFCNPCEHICYCNHVRCQKTMHLPQDLYEQWRRLTETQAKETKRERIRYGEKLLLLSDYPSIPENYIEQVSKLFDL